MPNCTCNVHEVRHGHRPDCPLNKEFAPKPIAPRIPFEEMTRDEMIMAYTALRHDISLYVGHLHDICRLSIRLISQVEKQGPQPLDVTQTKEKLQAHLDA